MRTHWRWLLGWALWATLLTACSSTEDERYLPVELQPGATVLFDRGLVFQGTQPGLGTNQFLGIQMVDLARDGDQFVTVLTEGWVAAATFSPDRGNDNMTVVNPSGGFSTTRFLKSADGGRSWAGFRVNDGNQVLAGKGLFGWHLSRRGWLLVATEGDFFRLIRIDPEFLTPLPDELLERVKFLVRPQATSEWLGAYGSPHVLGGSRLEGFRVLREGELYLDSADYNGDQNRLPYNSFAGLYGSRDGSRYFGVAPLEADIGACRLETSLVDSARPREPVPCVGLEGWSPSLPLRSWGHGAENAPRATALLSWGPTAVFTHRGVTWAYPLEGDLDPSRARRLAPGQVRMGWGQLHGVSGLGSLHARVEGGIAVEGPDGARRFFDVASGGQVFELKFPPSPCLPGGSCGRSATLEWAARLEDGQYYLVYQVDKVRQGFDQHPVFYGLRASVERVPVESEPPASGLRGWFPHARDATPLERACLAAAHCGLRLQAGLLQGAYSTLAACSQFFSWLQPGHPRRQAFETAPARGCGAVMDAWNTRQDPVVRSGVCPTRCEGPLLVGCDAAAQPVQFDCGLEHKTCGSGQTGEPACVPAACEAADRKTCQGTTTEVCFQQQVLRRTDCASVGLGCDPKSGSDCGATPSAEDDCLLTGPSQRSDEAVRCLGSSLTWCGGLGQRHFVECAALGATRCEPLCATGDVNCPSLEGRCK